MCFVVDLADWFLQKEKKKPNQPSSLAVAKLISNMTTVYFIESTRLNLAIPFLTQFAKMV